MASSRVKRHLPILEYLRDLNESERRNFVKNASPELLKTISEISLNILKGGLELPSGDIQKSKKYKKQIICLSAKRPSCATRRKICAQRGGFLGSLISVALPLIIQGIITAVKKR